MTIHKSQGSQFRHVIIVLPPGDSPIMTKELLYTAITRAQQELTVVIPATDAKAPHPFRHGVRQRIQRLSGLKERLWREVPLQEA
jgi:exodeoxyribonuclease V alpha subunit